MKWWRLTKSSKFIKSNFKNDLQNVVNKYNEKGYRDFRIVKDTTYINENNNILINIYSFFYYLSKFKNKGRTGSYGWVYSMAVFLQRNNKSFT